MDNRGRTSDGWPRRLGRWWWLGVWLAGAMRLSAHDLWLEPNVPLAARGDELMLHLQFGDGFKSEEERPLQKDHVLRFDLFSDRAQRRNLLMSGQDEQLPAAKVRLESGASLAVMDRGARPITMPPDKFTRYLTDEGQDAVIAQRAKLGQTDQPGRETYSRYLKTLIQERDLTTATPSTLYKRRTGQRLEILLETDPGRMKPGAPLVIKVLFEDKPLSGARVFAYHRTGNESPSDALTATTSVRGLAEFKVDRPGLWLVRLVHVQPAAARSQPTQPLVWESFWAAYVFAVRELSPPVALPTPKETEHDGDGHH